MAQKQAYFAQLQAQQYAAQQAYYAQLQSQQYQAAQQRAAQQTAAQAKLDPTTTSMQAYMKDRFQIPKTTK
jgi:hypothetical protein